MFDKTMIRLVMGVLCAAVLFVGCESSDNDTAYSDTGDGSATVSGTLESVSSLYVPAGVQGITVDLVQDGKVILRTMTDASGKFTFYGVPAGSFTLVFHVQGQELASSETVNVSEPSTEGGTVNVILGKVQVSAAGKVEQVIEEEAEIEVTVEVVEEPAPPAAPAVHVGGTWIFNWNGRHDTLTLTQQDATLTGSMTAQSNLPNGNHTTARAKTLQSYTVTGTIAGSQVSLSFAGNISDLPADIQSATGTAVAGSTILRAKPTLLPGPAPLPFASSMSGTWIGTPSNTDTWTASRQVITPQLPIAPN